MIIRKFGLECNSEVGGLYNARGSRPREGSKSAKKNCSEPRKSKSKIERVAAAVESSFGVVV